MKESSHLPGNWCQLGSFYSPHKHLWWIYFTLQVQKFDCANNLHFFHVTLHTQLSQCSTNSSVTGQPACDMCVQEILKSRSFWPTLTNKHGMTQAEQDIGLRFSVTEDETHHKWWILFPCDWKRQHLHTFLYTYKICNSSQMWNIFFITGVFPSCFFPSSPTDIDLELNKLVAGLGMDLHVLKTFRMLYLVLPRVSLAPPGSLMICCAFSVCTWTHLHD